MELRKNKLMKRFKLFQKKIFLCKPKTQPTRREETTSKYFPYLPGIFLFKKGRILIYEISHVNKFIF